MKNGDGYEVESNVMGVKCIVMSGCENVSNRVVLCSGGNFNVPRCVGKGWFSNVRCWDGEAMYRLGAKVG